jgi:nucleoside-diphosphate-sugar epimerase
MAEVALVTGASGFVGRHLVHDLLAAGWEVHAVGRDSDRFRALGATAGLRLHLDSDTEGLVKTVASVRPGVCFHLASYFVAQHQTADVAPLIRSNLDFPIRLAEALSRLGNVVMVNVGTAWQHRDGRGYGPVDLYAATKQAFEDVLRFYAESGGVRVVNVKLFDTYGPGDSRPKLFKLLLDAVRSGTELGLSPGEQLIDLVHVTDVVAALRRAGELAGPDMSGFGLSSGRPVTVRQLVTLIQGETGGLPRVVWGARDYRPGEMFEAWDAGPPLPGWKPRIDLLTGVRQAIAAP